MYYMLSKYFYVSRASMLCETVWSLVIVTNPTVGFPKIKRLPLGQSDKKGIS